MKRILYLLLVSSPALAMEPNASKESEVKRNDINIKISRNVVDGAAAGGYIAYEYGRIIAIGSTLPVIVAAGVVAGASYQVGKNYWQTPKDTAQ